MSGNEVHAGGCLCGAIRFEAKTSARKPHSCSCKMCQRHTGALTIAWVEFPKAAVAWIGPGGEPETFRSSDHSSRVFCHKCGSTLGAIDDAPVVALLLGVFDNVNNEQLIPLSHSFHDDLPEWWHIEIHKK